jgi:glycosyltransferase involved in cell wall biosynthesis
MNIFIIVPNLDLSGPVKGSIALCNGLVKKGYRTKLITLSGGESDFIDAEVEVIDFSKYTLLGKLSHLKKLLIRTPHDKGICISSCLIPDLLNLLACNRATTVSSVRGNLYKNYSSTYGWLGYLIALIHLMLLKGFDHVVAISATMFAQLQVYGFRNCSIIHNFIDEQFLEQSGFRKNYKKADAIEFVFMASLISRKRPELLIKTFVKLFNKHNSIVLHIIGDGPMRHKLENHVKDMKLDDKILFHGHKKNPFELLIQADYQILPSESEGISRSAMESLYLGIPCILRNVDANHELITPNVNGYLFDEDEELFDVLDDICSKKSRIVCHGEILLSENFRQQIAIERYEKLLATYQ